MLRNLLFVLIVLTCAHVIRSSNILVFVPSSFKSHVVSFQPFFLELTHRGHNLTVVTQFPVKNPPTTNYTEIVIKHEVDEFACKLKYYVLLKLYLNLLSCVENKNV